MSPPLSADPFKLKEGLPKIFFEMGEGEWDGHGVFNSNEYYVRTSSSAPDEDHIQRVQAMRDRVEACAELYSQTTTMCGHTIKEITRERERGFASNIAKFPSRPTTQSFFVEFDYPSVRLSFQFALVSIKSFLDALSKLLEGPLEKKIRGFDRREGNVGGEVLRILRNSTATVLPNREELITLIEFHKVEWIDEVVNMRDGIVHERDKIKDFINFWTTLEPGRTHPYDRNDIHYPVLSNGERVDQFFQRVLPLIRKFTLAFRDLTFPPEERKRNLETHSNH